MKKKSSAADADKKKSVPSVRKDASKPPKNKDGADKLRKNKATYPDRFLANDPINW